MKLIETLTPQALGWEQSLQSPNCRVILHMFRNLDCARWGVFLTPSCLDYYRCFGPRKSNERASAQVSVRACLSTKRCGGRLQFSSPKRS
jgi:hypothetical protein